MSELQGRLTQLREKQEILQEDVAKAIGTSIIGYQRYEYGTQKPDSDTLIRLADYFGCSIDYLVGRVPQDYFALLEEIEDEYLSELVLERMKNDSGARVSWEEHLARHGISQEELDAMEDVEIE